MALLEGKVAVITGAGGGLGAAYARRLASEGARVVVNDLGVARDGSGADSGPAETVAAEIRAAGGKAISNTSDVSSEKGGQQIFDETMAAFGRVDILINNAGILRDGTLHKSTLADWDKVIAVHLRGTYCVTRPIYIWMRGNGGGVIVNTSSTSGLFGNFGQSNYGAAKAGIAGLTRVMAIEGARYGVRVWGLAPGAMTRMTRDLAEFADEATSPGASPEEVAEAVLYMVSDLSGNATGKFLGVSRMGIREIKVMQTPGWKPAPGWGVNDLAAHERDIFFPES